MDIADGVRGTQREWTATLRNDESGAVVVTAYGATSQDALRAALARGVDWGVLPATTAAQWQLPWDCVDLGLDRFPGYPSDPADPRDLAFPVSWPAADADTGGMN